MCYWTQNVCFDFLHKFCLKHFSLKEEWSEIWSKMYIGLLVKCRLFLPYVNKTWIFLFGFRRILRYQISRKYVEWEPSSMRTDGHDEANSRFSRFCRRASIRPAVYKNWLHVSANVAVIRRSCCRNIQRKAESSLVHNVVVLITA